MSGLIERVTYFNEENGYAVLKVMVQGQRDLVTAVGSLPSVSAGEWLTAQGDWVQDRQYGRQFKATVLHSSAPTTREGIEKYLGSGMVKGIGPVSAKKLVEKFGSDIFDIIESSSARLEEVDGIGPKRRRVIKEAWAAQKVIRDIMVFLHSQGVSTSRAVRIYKTYGEEAVEKVRNNPYALARDIHGIGFKSADQIARNLGIPADSLLRAEAGLAHTLMEASGQGHCALPAGELLQAARDLLQIAPDTLDTALARMIDHGDLVAEELEGTRMVFLPGLRLAEQRVAARVRALVRAPLAYPPIDIPKALQWCEEKAGIRLAEMQREAVTSALTHRLVIVTGGPGVGKTTLVNSILRILRAKKVQCLLCAPTGRAAKRLTETSGMEAKTIHRLLEVDGTSGRFQRHESNPLPCDLLVVDECSMVDINLMQHLLRAVPPRGAVVLVGDADQLPSVGPGSVLNDLIRSGVVPTVRLNEVFRQAQHSAIIRTAHRINVGQLPEPSQSEDSDFFYLPREHAEDIQDTLLTLVKSRLPARYQLDPVRDIQVLAPMHRGSLGVQELNQRLQRELNPPSPNKPSVERFGWAFRAGDKVIQLENNYDKEVFNGDLGFVSEVDEMEREMVVRFDRGLVRYDYGELDELALAYAITIHKSQGSEFPAVVIPLAMQQYMLLQRNLLYTGITRGRKLVVVVGQEKALATAVRNKQTRTRYTGLVSRLLKGGEEEGPDDWW